MRRSLNLDDESSWLISSIILLLITFFLHLTSTLEKTFLLFIFVIPTAISLSFSLYLLIKRLRRR
ncbi:MAG: hypothetical protein DRN61_01200 [Thaumarchaeota archaeon]|nr:MAG: hypothetical protein DRN54_01615 [Nitrososphaerota archaeon]RLG05252.1 MAG: hypothetical protein DRN61_01200 [Nitrososphaerota archaeon]HDD42933.1 hypothetical protein [Nitrososphaeria archaeon]